MVIYPINDNGQRTGTMLFIDNKTIKFIKNAIKEKGIIQMGACRDNPPPNSLGKMLQGMGKSPQFLSYVLPLLEQEGFLTSYKEGKAFWVKKTASREINSINKTQIDGKGDIEIPDKDEFIKGCNAFKKREKRDSMYKVATFLVKHFWGSPRDMSDALGILLFTWNHAFYRYGLFDYDKLEKCIKNNIPKLEEFRNRNIFNLKRDDERDIKNLFNNFHKALQISEGRLKGKSSPVAVSKALHLLAPDFLPLWDNKIAQAYGCYYSVNPAEEYVRFCRIVKAIAEQVKDFISPTDKTILKLIDEYNYSKYTQEWI
ncbi:MAG: hypothetical protein HXY53_09410 [Nitrospirae bacterium]|nr:hypothetical protein [Nitrospirota bacterium]